MKRSILRQSIRFHGRSTQQLRSFRISTGMVITHPQFVHGLALWLRGSSHISFQRRYGSHIVFQAITGLPLNAHHFRFVLVSGKMAQIIRCHFIRLLELSSKQMDFSDVVRNQGIVHIILLQRRKCFQGLVVSTFHIVDVTQVIDSIRPMVLADILQQSKPNFRFFQIVYLQIGGRQFQYRLIAFLIGQGVQVAGLIESNRFQKLSFLKIDGSHHRFYPIGMSRIRILLQIRFQQFNAVIRSQLILFTDAGIFLIPRHIFRQHLLRHTRYGKAHQSSHPNGSFLHLLFGYVMFF